MTGLKVAICICTFRRPDGLRKLLQHLGKLDAGPEVTIVVADNDDEQQEGIQLIDQMRPTLRWPIISAAVTEQGISYSRNTAAGLALETDPDLVAFIDDDEWPEPHWLNELIRVQQITGADAVGGPTNPAFPDGVNAETRSNDYYGADMKLPDASFCQLEAAGNFLIKAETLRNAGPLFFHPDFARSGGEDLAFFMRLQQSGSRMAWAANAEVWETVTEDRLSLAWMQRRVMLIANSRVHVLRMLQPGLVAALIRGVKTLALCAQATLLSVIGLGHPETAEKARLLRWKFWGKLTAHLNIKPVRIEGR